MKPNELKIFSLGQEVYLRTDPDQYKRIVTGITNRANGIMYELSLGVETYLHHDFEISETKDIMMDYE